MLKLKAPLLSGLLGVVAMVLVGATTALAQIAVTLPSNMTGEVGETVLIPVTVTSVNGQGVVAFDGQIAYDEDVLDVIDIIEEGGITTSNVTTNAAQGSQNGVVNVAWAGATPLQGGNNSILFYLQAQVVGTGSSALDFNTFQFYRNTGNIVTTRVNGSFSATGTMVQFPTLTVGENASFSYAVTTSDLTDRGVTSYEFTVAYNPSVVNFSGVDVAGTLSADCQAVANPDNTAGQMQVAVACAAPLTGSGTLIELNGTSLGTGNTALTVSGFQFNGGQVQVTATSGSVVVAGIGVTIESRTDRITGEGDLALTTGDLTGDNVTAFEFTLAYDPSIVHFNGVDVTGTLSAACQAVANPDNDNGQMQVAVACPAALTGSGTLLNLDYTAVGLGTSVLDLQNFEFNSGVPGATAMDGSFTSVANLAPVFTNVLPDTTIQVGSTLRFDYDATDADGENVTFSLAAAPNFAVLNGTTGELILTPTFGETGDFTVTVVATDESGNSVVTSAVVTVEDVPTMPIAQARTLPNGTQVRVLGTVSRAIGRNAFIQDNSGTIQNRPTGIAVFQSNGPFRVAINEGDVREGDVLDIIGTLSEFGEQLQITPVDFRVITRNQDVTPTDVTLQELINTCEADKYEGELVRVRDFQFAEAVRGENFTASTNYTITPTQWSQDPSDLTFVFRVPPGSDTQLPGTTVPVNHVREWVGVVTEFNDTCQLIGMYQREFVDQAGTPNEPGSGLPTEFALQGNYPNPFSGTTTIRFDLPTASQVSLVVMDVLGRQVISVDPQHMAAGSNLILEVNASGLAAGAYLYRLAATDADGQVQVKTGRMTLVK